MHVQVRAHCSTTGVAMMLAWSALASVGPVGARCQFLQTIAVWQDRGATGGQHVDARFSTVFGVAEPLGAGHDFFSRLEGGVEVLRPALVVDEGASGFSEGASSENQVCRFTSAILQMIKYSQLLQASKEFIH